MQAIKMTSGWVVAAALAAGCGGAVGPESGPLGKADLTAMQKEVLNKTRSAVALPPIAVPDSADGRFYYSHEVLLISLAGPAAAELQVGELTSRVKIEPASEELQGEIQAQFPDVDSSRVAVGRAEVLGEACGELGEVVSGKVTLIDPDDTTEVTVSVSTATLDQCRLDPQGDPCRLLRTLVWLAAPPQCGATRVEDI